MLRIKLPVGVKIKYNKSAAYLYASKGALTPVVQELRQFAETGNGAIAKMADLTLKVSNTISPIAVKPKSVVMPVEAWEYLVERFSNVLAGNECNPLHFNECGYLNPPVDYDLGILVTDMAVTNKSKRV